MGDNQHRVDAAKGEGVRHDGVDLEFLRHIGHSVDGTTRIRLKEINRRRRNLFAQRRDGDSQFKTAARAKRVTMNRLGRGDRDFSAVLSENAPDRFRLGDVVGVGRRAVRIDVVDLAR